MIEEGTTLVENQAKSKYFKTNSLNLTNKKKSGFNIYPEKSRLNTWVMDFFFCGNTTIWRNSGSHWGQLPVFSASKMLFWLVQPLPEQLQHRCPWAFGRLRVVANPLQRWIGQFCFVNFFSYFDLFRQSLNGQWVAPSTHSVPWNHALHSHSE